MNSLFNYINKDSIIHRLSGATKLVLLLFVVLSAMVTFDTRYLICLTIFSISLLVVSKIKLREIKALIYITVVFLFMNNFFIYLFSPQYGIELYGTKHLIFKITNHYIITQEQLLYHLNIVLKFIITIPMVVLFVYTTKANEFASSLNKIGVNYKIAYSVSLALRYIPDIAKEYSDISMSMQARGVELSKKENLFKRLIKSTHILFPLILSSMHRIDIVSNAMELRSFGKNKKRTWYVASKFKRNDYIFIIISIILLVISLVLNYINGSRFYNPFI